jgi:hypothetical protein
LIFERYQSNWGLLCGIQRTGTQINVREGARPDSICHLQLLHESQFLCDWEVNLNLGTLQMEYYNESLIETLIRMRLGRLQTARSFGRSCGCNNRSNTLFI